VRQVGDIGRMVDEFSAFARMPQPVIRPENLAQIAREALVLQKAAHPEIAYEVTIPDSAPMGLADSRLIGQALTNLLQNAADAVAARPRPEGESGRIAIRLDQVEDGFAFVVEDDGLGLPDGEERARLTEPYVTHKAKGTGLGLAIVKKIM
jgi:two-component system nitrogen regulation sensor histidine kinase NtrY